MIFHAVRRSFAGSSARLRPLVILETPPAAERLVEIDHREELIPLRLSQSTLGRKQLLLRLEHLEVVRPTGAITLSGYGRGLSQRHDFTLYSHTLIHERLARDQRIGCLAESDYYRLLVLRDGLVPVRLLGVIGGFQPAALKDRARDRAADAPDIEFALEHVLDLRALAAEQRAKSDPGIEVGHRDAKLGVGADHALLSLQDVRSALEQVGCQADRRLRCDLCGERYPAIDRFGKPAQEHTQSVLLLSDRSIQILDARTARVVRCLSAHHPELRIPARPEARCKEIQSLPIGVAAFLRNHEFPVELDQGKVTFCDAADERQHHAAAHIFLGIEARAGGFGGVTDPSPHIEFPGRAEQVAKRVEGDIAPRAFERTECLLTARNSLIAHLGVEVGLRNADQRSSLLDAGNGHSQIVVIGEGLHNQRLKSLVVENAPPRQIRDRSRLRWTYLGPKVRGELPIGPFVNGSHRATRDGAYRQQRGERSRDHQYLRKVRTHGVPHLLNRGQHFSEPGKRQKRVCASNQQHLRQIRPYHPRACSPEQHRLGKTDEVRRRHELHDLLQSYRHTLERRLTARQQTHHNEHGKCQESELWHRANQRSEHDSKRGDREEVHQEHRNKQDHRARHGHADRSLHHQEQRTYCRYHDNQSIRPDLGEHELERAQRHHQ